MSDVLRFRISTMTEFLAPTGRRYLRGDVGGLRLTFVEEPGRDPADGGAIKWSAWVSPATEAAPSARHPAPARTPAFTPRKPPTKAERETGMLADVQLRMGAIPIGGDDIPALGVQDEDDILSRPLVSGEIEG
uniref:Uncharacterized protein n=1 Tax=Bosea sp. NBC_00436 TaxID=2969620 RepID=A0A9E7ZKJ5_9HYPH